MKRIFFLKHSPLHDLIFTKNSNDFIVSEIPLYDFSNEGEHLVLHVRKKDVTTWEMLKVFSEVSGAKVRDFGYAGLKDKDGLTMQYVSILKKYESAFENFSHPKIKILDKTYHKNKIKIGHLKGNRFFIRLKKVSSVSAKKLEDGLSHMKLHGYPNFFGYQRFGREKSNANDGLEILQGKRRVKNRKMEKFLISAYQSELFNSWLSRRIEISHLFSDFSVKELKSIFSLDEKTLKETKNQKQFFKIFKGDILHHYPHGKAFLCEDLPHEEQRFFNHEVSPTGWLVGNRAIRSEDVAKSYEDEIFKSALPYIDKMTGSRRYAWSFLEDVDWNYREEEAWFEMNFTLQKGSYATVVLHELIKEDMG